MSALWTFLGYTEGSRHSKLDTLDFVAKCEIEQSSSGSDGSSGVEQETIVSVECVGFPDDPEIVITQMTETSVQVYIEDPSYLFDRLLISYNFYSDSNRVFTTRDPREVPEESNMFSYKTDPRQTIIKTFVFEATSSLGSVYSKTLDVIIENNWTADSQFVRSFYN